MQTCYYHYLPRLAVGWLGYLQTRHLGIRIPTSIQFLAHLLLLTVNGSLPQPLLQSREKSKVRLEFFQQQSNKGSFINKTCRFPPVFVDYRVDLPIDSVLSFCQKSLNSNLCFILQKITFSKNKQIQPCCKFPSCQSSAFKLFIKIY